MNEKFPIKSILYPEQTGEPIARTLKELREHTYPIPDSPEDPDTIELPDYERIKTEAYALTAYIIEKVHDDTFKNLALNPDELVIKRAITYPVSEQTEVNRFYLTRAREDFLYAKGALYCAEQAYVSAFVDALQTWSKHATEGKGSALHDHKVYSRLHDVLSEAGLTASRKVDLIHLVESFIIRGANTVGSVSFDVLRAIPFAYYNKYGRIISPSEYHDIARQAEALVIQLSSLHIHSFSRLMQFARAGETLNKSVYLEFPLEFFSLEDKGGTPRFVFDQDALTSFERYKAARGGNKDDEARLGCPARDARTGSTGDKNMSVVSAVYRHYISIADSLITPHLEAYTEDLLERATKPPKKFSLDEVVY
jgi:hypothetical protein